MECPGIRWNVYINNLSFLFIGPYMVYLIKYVIIKQELKTKKIIFVYIYNLIFIF